MGYHLMHGWLPHDALNLMLLGLIGIIPVMAGVAWQANRWRNAGLVDIFWALGLCGLGVFYGLAGNGWPARQLLAGGMLAVANGRLAWHLFRRFRPDKEDGRYAALRAAWIARHPQSRVDSWFTLIILGQGILLTGLTAPVAVACSNTDAFFRSVEWIGIVVWAIGMAISTSADGQLAAFKRKNTDPKDVCDYGWWGLSRHPNYLGEWLTWIGYWLVASPQAWGTVVVPITMYILLRYLSGVGATESLALQTKGDAYRQYQQRVPVFFPTLTGILSLRQRQPSMSKNARKSDQ